MGLAEALAALRANDARTALVAMLAVWRATPDRELAAAIDRVGALAARSHALGDDWLAAAERGDPIDVHLLVASVAETPNGYLPDRLRALAKLDDPRADLAIVRRLVDGNFPALTEWRALLALLPGLRDPRVSDALPALTAKKTWAGHMNAARTAANRVPARPPALLSAGERALVAQIVEAIPIDDRAEVEAALLAAVYAAPHHDGPREVYADWLLERGDPRGEFITLQLAATRRQLTDDERQRMKQLEDAHLAEWLGPLRAIGVIFERGFFAKATFHVPAELADDPSLSTLVECTGFPPPPAWSSIKSIANARNEDLIEFAKLPPTCPLRSLHWQYPNNPLLDDAIRGYTAAALPALRNVTIHGNWSLTYDMERWRPEDIPWLFENRALDELTICAVPQRLPGYAAILAPTTIRRFALRDYRDEIELLRDDAGHLSIVNARLHGIEEDFINTLADALAAMPRVTRFTISPTYKRQMKILVRTRKRIEAALGHHADATFELNPF